MLVDVFERSLPQPEQVMVASLVVIELTIE